MNTLTLHGQPNGGPPPTSFVLSFGTFVVGRSTKCDVCVVDETVSRRHAVLTVSDTVCVCDLGSRNGTYVEGDRVEKAVVRVGQRLKFGSVAFVLTIASNESDGPGSEIETAKTRMAVQPAPYPELSKAQKRVMVLILEGLPEKQVATRLRISRTTVHNHVQVIYRAFNVHSRPELLVRLLTRGAASS